MGYIHIGPHEAGPFWWRNATTRRGASRTDAKFAKHGVIGQNRDPRLTTRSRPDPPVEDASAALPRRPRFHARRPVAHVLRLPIAGRYAPIVLPGRGVAGRRAGPAYPFGGASKFERSNSFRKPNFFITEFTVSKKKFSALGPTYTALISSSKSTGT